jgi:hypothetical protein
VTGNRGQALVESAVVSGFCIMFFLFCFKFFISFLHQLQEQQNQLEQEVCKMTDRNPCASDGGFVLVSTLIQLMAVIFAGHLVMAFMAVQDYRWRSLNSCFESGLQSVTGANVDVSEKIKQMNSERAHALSPLINIETYASAPVASEPVTTGPEADSGSKSVHYILRWRYLPPALFNFFSFSKIEQTYKCGAKRLCNNEKCTYSLIADRF